MFIYNDLWSLDVISLPAQEYPTSPHCFGIVCPPYLQTMLFESRGLLEDSAVKIGRVC